MVSLDAPVLLTLGGAETSEIPANVYALHDELLALGHDVELRVYGGAMHSWFHEARDEFWPDIAAWMADRP